MNEYQVIIAGSGPAGTSCAKALKDEGIESLILEKKKLPRNKMCSGILFGQTQVLLKKYFGALPPEELYCEPKVIPAKNILEWKKGEGFRQYIWELPKDEVTFPQDYLNIWRKDFDYWLLKQSDTQYKDRAKVKKIEFVNDKVKLIVSTDNGNEEFICSYFVGADGMDSHTRKTIDPLWFKEAQEVPSYQAYYRFKSLGKLKDAHWYVFLEKEIGDVISCVHRKDDFLTMYVGALRGRNLKQCMKKFKSFLSEGFQVEFGEMERDEGCIYRLSNPLLGKGRILLVGDAAGLVYLNGEGISVAIDSGWRAGKAIAKAIKNDGDGLTIYQNSMDDVLRHMQYCLKKMHFVVS